MTTLTDVFDTEDDLLAAFPARPSEIRIGYARMSAAGLAAALARGRVGGRPTAVREQLLRAPRTPAQLQGSAS
ncbi:hypothetical protein [Streptomyces sp. NPDC002640]